MEQTKVASDADALRGVAQGSEVSFSVLYNRHGPAVVKMAWAYVPERGIVEEIVQDTFLTLWQRADSISLAGSSVLPWLLVTCRNHCRNRRRKDARWASVILQDASRFDAPVEDSTVLRWVQESIDQLPVLDREVCQLCLVDGHTYASAAAVVGTTPSAIGKRLERAKLKLRRALS